MRKSTIILLLFAFNSIISQTWTQLSDYPGAARDDGSSFVIGNKAYCITGGSGSSCNLDGYQFDGATETWSTMASLPSGSERQYCTSWSYNGKGYLLAGVTCSNTYLTEFKQYDPAANTWTTLPAFPGSGRHGSHNFRINDKVYVIGGWDNSIYLKQVWEYNLTSGVWTQKNDLPISGFWRGAAFSISGKGYIAYGFTNSNNFNHKIYEYNQGSDSWTPISGITLDARKYLGCEVLNNKAFFYAGQDSLNAVLNDVVIFDPATNSVTAQNGIPTNGRKGGMTFVLNNLFYITTGFNASNTRIKETWKTDGVVGLREELRVGSLELRVYPNPSSDVLNISAEVSFAETNISILNSLGQKMNTEIVLNDKTALIDTKELANGIYFLNVKTKSGQTTKRFVVLH